MKNINTKKLIWLDIIDPKYVLFFKSLILILEEQNQVLVTTRISKDYDETKKLLDLFNIKYICVGKYGGSKKLDKYKARLDREKEFIKLFKSISLPSLFITGSSVEGTHTAFALGIKIVIFSDTPIKNYYFNPAKNLNDITILSRLMLPLADIVFYPFWIPNICYQTLGIKKYIPYHFIDVALWLENAWENCHTKSIRNTIKKDFISKLNLNPNLPIILCREEEYKAHYIDKKSSLLYEIIDILEDLKIANIVIISRYESLQNKYKNYKMIKVLKEKLMPQNLYPACDIMLGGGGTMNLESAYLGIPTISLRSIFLFHDKMLLKNKIMLHAKDSKTAMKYIKQILKSPIILKDNRHIFAYQNANFNQIYLQIKKSFL